MNANDTLVPSLAHVPNSVDLLPFLHLRILMYPTTMVDKVQT